MHQWRVSMGGPYALDYNVLPMMFDMFNVTDKDERIEVMDAIQVIENGALRILAERAQGD